MNRDGAIFQSRLLEVCQNLAKSVVRDGEGATKFVEICVKGTRNQEDAKRAAYAIAHSPLVKTAFFGMDANWGRILCAIGHSGIRIDPNRIDLFFDRKPIVKNGRGVGGKQEIEAGQVLKNKSFKVTVNLHQGKNEFSVFTTDLSLDYVKINASYRS
jgi:glutamate N-acetyltransferase/amino-acid N-acetyltransferase